MVTKKATTANLKRKTVNEFVKHPDKEDSFEISSHVSADKVLGFLKGKAIGLAERAGAKIAGWVAGQVLELIGFQDRPGPSQLDEIQETLESIKTTQAEVLGRLKDLLTEITFSSLLTREVSYVKRVKRVTNASWI